MAKQKDKLYYFVQSACYPKNPKSIEVSKDVYEDFKEQLEHYNVKYKEKYEIISDFDEYSEVMYQLTYGDDCK